MRFDHCFQKIKNGSEYLSLANRGFHLSDEIMEHPGKQICRFLMFRHRDPKRPNARQYLEFVEIAEFEALRKTYPPETEESVMWEPGFSFVAPSSLKEFYEKNMNSLIQFEPKLTHRNYQWQTDSTSYLPGWNFLNFENPIVPGIHIWCTEYEPLPEIKARPPVTPHPNTASQIVGFIWNLKPSTAQAITGLTESSITNKQILLSDGTTIYLDSSFSTSEKQFPFSAVVLKCDNWGIFCEKAKPDQFLNWNGQEAALIKFESTGWDIVVLKT